MRGLVAALVALVVGAPAVHAAEATFSVAISMKDAVEQLGRRFVRTHPGTVLYFNFGGSGALQQQIDAGAPVDLFISAGQRPMDALARQGLIVPATRRTFARNALVVVTPADSRLGLAGPADLAGPGVSRIVIGNPRTVPAGQYAEASLRALGLWARLESRLILAENVRQALDYVARGEVDAGFVYATDAALRPDRVREAFRPPEASYGPILYPVAVVATARQPAVARAFIDLLVDREGQAVLAALGFLPPPVTDR